jgi:hypothetical protein
MKSNLRINTRIRRLIHYIEDMEKGLVQIPAFQRDFVWREKDKLDLFDSLKRGYPIGSILFWQPTKSYGEREQIGPYYIPIVQDQTATYILDGFQRLSTIFGCLINPNKTNLSIDKRKLEKEFSIYYDLEEEEFFIPRALSKTEAHQIPLYILIDTFEFIAFSQKLAHKPNFNELLYRAQVLATTLVDFNLPSIDIIGGEIDEAVEIFSRINSKGTNISSDWILSALTYSQDENFRLGTVIDQLVDDLSSFNFQKIKRDIIFKCITHSFGKPYFDQSKKVEQIARRSDFINITKKTINSIKKAAAFLFEELLVLDIKLLPYNAQLIFVTDFFNQIEEPSREELEKLKKWFWITTYSNYFTIYSLSKQREAYYVFQEFLKDSSKNPVYNDNPKLPFTVLEFPSKISFGSVRYSALILFLLNHSNGFESVDSDQIDSFQLKHLFLKEKAPEGILTIIEKVGARYQKSKDMSYLLDPNYDIKKFEQSLEPNNIEEPANSYSTKEKIDIPYRHFLSIGSNNDVATLELLEQRKRLIQQAEKIFTEKLGLVYDQDNGLIIEVAY